jgi:hypothetical protein
VQAALDPLPLREQGSCGAFELGGATLMQQKASRQGILVTKSRSGAAFLFK